MRLDELLKTEIGKKQYRELAMRYHSDLNKDGEEVMKQINAAKDSDNADTLIDKLYKKYIPTINTDNYTKPENIDKDGLKNQVNDFIDNILSNYFAKQYSQLRFSVIHLKEYLFDVVFYNMPKNEKLQSIKLKSVDFKPLKYEDEYGVDSLINHLGDGIESILN